MVSVTQVFPEQRCVYRELMSATHHPRGHTGVLMVLPYGKGRVVEDGDWFLFLDLMSGVRRGVSVVGSVHINEEMAITNKLTATKKKKDEKQILKPTTKTSSKPVSPQSPPPSENTTTCVKLSLSQPNLSSPTFKISSLTFKISCPHYLCCHFEISLKINNQLRAQVIQNGKMMNVMSQSQHAR